MNLMPGTKYIVFFAFWTGIVSVQSQESPMVLSTASMMNDMAKNIGGENFSYATVVPIGSDPHLYEPTPGDARSCHSASIILMNGLTFEGWLAKLIKNSGTKAHIKTITEGVVAIASEQYANATDPHAWMSAANGLIYCQNIRDVFIDFMPEKEQEFRANYTRYKAKIEALDQYISRKISSIPEEKRILITSHDAFQYYGRRYNIRLEAILGTSTDADVQTSDVQRLNEVIRNTAVPAAFIESTISPRLLGQIAKDNGIVIGGKLFADSLSEEEGPAGTYLKMLRYNTDIIYEGLLLPRQGAEDGGNHAEKKYNWLWGLLLAPIALALMVFVTRVIKN
jgi:ABC-type Zn uptake system ZnuABC Zn-binding protein ZnuA